MTEDELFEVSCRHEVARLIQSIVMVLLASHCIVPAARWYAAKVFSAVSQVSKLKVWQHLWLKCAVKMCARIMCRILTQTEGCVLYVR